MLSFLNKKIKVAVHDGKFHADDVFSVAALSLYLKKPLQIFRTRDPKILEKMDYVLDVGREYSPKDFKFDHHQEGWSEKRSNGIPYATIGLLWKEYGVKIAGSYETANRIDEKIIQYIDAEDNGVETFKNVFDSVSPYCVSDYIQSLNPSWSEKKANSLDLFKEAVAEAKKMLEVEIKKAADNVLSKKKVQEAYEKAADKRILVLDDDYTWKKTIASFPEPLFVIKQFTEDKVWSVKAVNENGFKYKNRLDFPLSWAGRAGNDLAEVSGVADAVFCHNKRFLCVAKSEEGAIELAKRAIANSKS